MTTTFTCKLCSWDHRLPWWAEKFPESRHKAVADAFSELEGHLFKVHGKDVGPGGAIVESTNSLARKGPTLCVCRHPLDHIHNSTLIGACIECGGLTEEA